MPGQATKTLKDKILKKFSKCFSRLEGLPARELRAELRKSLCNPREQVAKINPRARDCGMRLDLPATESPKQGKNDF